MGSFKEYYEDVGNYQTDLTKDQEKQLVTSLSDLRFSLKDAIFSIDGAPDYIKSSVKKLSSVATVTDDFNSNKQGNNATIEKKIQKLLTEPLVISNLHACNFRMEWLLTTILPALKPDNTQRKWIDDCNKRIVALEKQLVKSCLKLAVKLAMDNRGRIPHEDAVQIANLALVEAAKKFDPAVGVKFNTYAHHKVLFKMKQKLMEDPFGIVHIPRSAEVEEGTGSWLSLEEDVDVGRNRSLAEILPDDGPQADNIVDKVLIRDSLKESLGRFLTEQESEVIFLRYLSVDGKILTYQEVSEEMARPLTRERIRQIEDKALTKLRERPELRELLNFF